MEFGIGHVYVRAVVRENECLLSTGRMFHARWCIKYMKIARFLNDTVQDRNIVVI
jgi:hypothetical protein